MDKFKTFKEIDKAFDTIINSKNQIYVKYKNLCALLKNNIILNEVNLNYICDKVINTIIGFNNGLNILNGLDVMNGINNIYLNKNFKLEYLYKNPYIPWHYMKFNVCEIDKNFIIAYLDKNWNFRQIFENNILSFEEIKTHINTDTNFAVQCGTFFNVIVKNYDNFDMSILNNHLVRTNINNLESCDILCEHSNFDFSYVHLYPEINWSWNKLSLRGDMSIGQANKILEPLKIQNQTNYDENFLEKKKNAKSLMKNFDNLMLQPWMNSWFVKVHIIDNEDRRFYLRKLNRNCYEGRSKKRNEILWRELLDKAMSPERLFYWYLDNYELDNLFVGLLPDDHPRAKLEYQIRPGIYPSGKIV